MSIPFLNNLDLKGNQLLTALLEVLASAPGVGPEGRIIYRSDIKKIQWHNGTSYVGPYFDTTRLDQIVAPTASVGLNSQKITSLLDPSSPQDAATKAYVDSVSQGLDIKPSARVASTVNVTIATPGASVDGVSMTALDRVLLLNQTAPAENGVWVWNSAGGTMTRPSDFANPNVSSGAFIFVEAGTNADNGFVLTTDGAINVGTTSLAFAQFSGAGQITAGAGLSKTGNTLDVNVDSSSIEINADILRVKALGITNAMLAGSIDLTTKVTGLLPIANGGTNASSAATARANLGAGTVNKFAGDITGDAATTAFAVTHNLGTTDVQVQLFEATTNLLVFAEVVRTSTTVATVTFATAPANGKVYRCVVMA